MITNAHFSSRGGNKGDSIYVSNDGTATTKSFEREFDEVGNAFANMTIKEKEAAFNDLHGCPDEETAAQQENPKEILQKLAELDTELRKRTGVDYSVYDDRVAHHASLSTPLIHAYCKAYLQDKTYVEDRKFRLSFLRADLYNVKAAAQRIFLFFELKLNLFGIDKLTKSITYDDLSEDDLESLHCGALQILPSTDRAGRTVFVSLGHRRREKSIQNHVSVHYTIYLYPAAFLFFRQHRKARKK